MAETNRLSCCKRSKWRTKIFKRVIFGMGRRWRRLWKFSLRTLDIFCDNLWSLIHNFWWYCCSPVSWKAFPYSLRLREIHNWLFCLVRNDRSDLSGSLSWLETCFVAMLGFRKEWEAFIWAMKQTHIRMMKLGIMISISTSKYSPIRSRRLLF